jgi:putative transposase
MTTEAITPLPKGMIEDMNARKLGRPFQLHLADTGTSICKPNRIMTGVRFLSNRRLIGCDEKGITFKWKDYRSEGPDRYKVMTLATDKFIHRFLMHVLPAGFYRMRYYGLLASGRRAENVSRGRGLLTPPIIPVDAIKASSANAAELNDKSLSLLWRPHDYHRALRTPHDSTPPRRRASDQN